MAVLIKKAGLEDEDKAGPIRVYEIHSSKIHRELAREGQVVGISEYVTVIAERTPEEDLQPGEGGFIQVVHFQSEPSKLHGIPFKFRVIPVCDKYFSCVIFDLTFAREKNSQRRGSE